MSNASASAPWAKSCYAIDPNADQPVIVRATRSRAGVEYAILEEGASIPSISGASTVVATAVPARESITRWISAPFASARKAARVLPALLDIELPFAVEDCACEFLARQRLDTGGTRTLAVAARHTHLRRAIEAAKGSGGDPVVVDVEGLAAWTQSLREVSGDQPDDPMAVRIVVHLGTARTFMVIGQGQEYRGAHGIGDDPTRDITRLLRIQFEEPPGPIEWRWTGPGADDPERVRRLREALDPDWPGTHHVHDDATSFMARAIATRALLPGPYRCNLRRGRLVHPLIAHRASARSHKAAALFLVGAVLLCAANIGWRITAASREADMDRTLRDLAASAAGFPVAAKGEEALEIVKRARQASDARAEPLARLFSPSLSVAMHTILGSASSNGLTISTASFRPSNTGLTGEAPQWSNCQAFVDELARSGWRATPTRRDEAGGIVRFVFSIHPDS